MAVLAGGVGPQVGGVGTVVGGASVGVVGASSMTMSGVRKKEDGGSVRKSDVGDDLK